VVLETEDHFPWRVYAGYENTGPLSTGQDRFLTGFNWGNAFGTDDQLNYQFTSGNNISRFAAHSGSYVMPLPWRHVLTIFGNWATTDVQTAPGVMQTGEDWQISGRYEIPLSPAGGWRQSVIVGGDYKRSNSNAEFGGNSVFSSYVSVVQGMLGYEGSNTDARGSTDASLELYHSPGGVGAEDNLAAYTTSRAGANDRYTYAHLTADRVTNLPAQWAWVTRFRGQIASDPLVGSEQLGVGGLDSVRGYFEREGNGDDGVIFSNELHTPPVSFTKFLGRKDELVFLAFTDYGMSWTRGAGAVPSAQLNFWSVGPGVSYRIGPWLSVDYDYGWRLDRGNPGLIDTGRSSLRLVASFAY